MFRRILAPIFAYIPGPGEPTDPGFGNLPALDPGYDIGAGLRPDNSLPWAPGRPDNSLPRPPWPDLGWGVRPPVDPGYGRPDIGAGHPDNKPPGRPVLPARPDHGLPPNGGRPPHPWLPGHWEPIDPGFGKPPLWGWILGPDNGLPYPPVVPDNSLPGGIWVPTDPDYGKPIICPPCPGGKPHPPLWAWIPDRPSFPKPTPEPDGKATIVLYPTEGTAPQPGGSGSINLTIVNAGTWQVDPTPDWLTVTPQGPQTTDQQILYTVAVNTTGVARQASITVNGTKFTLNQSA